MPRRAGRHSARISIANEPIAAKGRNLWVADDLLAQREDRGHHERCACRSA
jgi:hypothetical protein